MSYDVFAEFYDGLTRNVDYKAKADYICDIFKRFNHTPECMLDLACGTGTLTVELKKRGFDIYGVDASFEMLSQAQNKAAEENLEMLFLCQKMQSLNLYGLIDTCICTLDSISHLQGESEVRKTFKKVAEFTEKGGLFIFDVNTLYKHREILGNNTFVYDTDEVFCVWQNTFDSSDNSVKIDLDFFIPLEEKEDCFVRSSESFKEFAYSTDDIKSMLEESGFDVLGVYDDMSFDQPKNDSQRATLVARKL